MRRFILLIFCGISFQCLASHIVGGEFEIKYTGTNYRYFVRLILYFDAKNGEPGAKDPTATVRIFRKRDNQWMDDVTLSLAEETPVEYFQPECAASSANVVASNRLVYRLGANSENSFFFSPSRYDDPEGYYIVWERCCRNYNITNIYSQIPNPGDNHDPNAAGQTFYLEFPPVVKNGEPFVNSTPRLFPPLSDYGCNHQYYYVDFSGTDDDEDSLVYSMVTPLNTHSTLALDPSAPFPAPYDSVRWRPGFGNTSFMMGAPDLKISPDGLLTVTPTREGLFVFAVRCIEYRDGVKIGEVRRDFQMFVIDCPDPPDAPKVEAKPISEPDDQFVSGQLVVNYPHNVTDENRCVQIRVTDPDSESAADGFEENVKIRAIPLGFKDKTVKDILPKISSAVLHNGSAAVFDVCFPECPYTGGPYQIGIIAQDNSCPLPRLDTMIISVNVIIPQNDPPLFANHAITATYLEGAPNPTWEIKATDANMDSIALVQTGNEAFDIADYGFTFVQTKNEKGLVLGTLQWDTRCDIVDFSDRTHFPFYFTADDKDFCNYTPADTMKFDLTMNLFDFHPPTIKTDLPPDNHITAKVYQSISFNVIGDDQDNDRVQLRGQGVDFNFAQKGVQFAGAAAPGHVEAPVLWPLRCPAIDLATQSEFEMEFIAVDEDNRCHYYLADTVKVKVTVEPPDNHAPSLLVTGNKPDYTLGEPVTFTLTAGDIDVPADNLLIELVTAEGTTEPVGYVFTADRPTGPNATFTWQPACEIFANDVYDNDYHFNFRVTDDRCFSVQSSDLDVDFGIKDVERGDADFLPPNIITPNGDGRNDFFAMVRRDENDNLVSILPKDNCTGTFVKMVVYNRWGTKVFETDNRDFRWVPTDEHVGVYFYTLKFTTFEYKGTVTLAF